MQARQQEVHELGVRDSDRHRHLGEREGERVQPLDLRRQGSDRDHRFDQKMSARAEDMSTVCICFNGSPMRFIGVVQATVELGLGA